MRAGNEEIERYRVKGDVRSGMMQGTSNQRGAHYRVEWNSIVDDMVEFVDDKDVK